MLFVFPHLISLNCLNIKIDIPAKFIQSYSFHLHDITLYECRVSVCVCVLWSEARAGRKWDQGNAKRYLQAKGQRESIG